MNFNKLSIIMPVYNEAATIEKILELVQNIDVGMEKEIIVVDDCSTDGTREILKNLEASHRIFYHNKNQGKGAALKTGFSKSEGDIVLIQDADLEYDPSDYSVLLDPIIKGRADVVYGSRFIGDRPHRVLYNAHYIANRFLTFLSNMLTGLNLTDMETGYKVFTRKTLDLIKSRLVSKRFGIEPELTARVAKNKFRVYEVGVSYSGRTYEEGKKITWRDGLAAIWHIIRFNLLMRK